MSVYDRLNRHVTVVPEETSYFSTPADSLDPRLFVGHTLRADIGRGVMAALYRFLEHRYANAQSWTHIWLAGSGVSYLWEAARDPGDLDCLVGINYPALRQSNPELAGLSDHEIQTVLNGELRSELWPRTERWNGYELTFYALPVDDISLLHPYAAYDVTESRWTVRPDVSPSPPSVPEWEQISRTDASRAKDIASRYDSALDEMDGVSNPGLRLNAQVTLRAAAREATLLYNDIHSGRDKAFSPAGMGFEDFNEYRYKAAKGSGALKALGTIAQDLWDAQVEEDTSLYGGLPDARHSLLLSAIGKRYK